MAWTVFVWGTRLRNADGSVGAIVLSSVFLVLALLVVVTRAHPLPVIALGGTTVIVWLVRLPLILIADHSLAFKAVHSAIGLASIFIAGACSDGGVARPKREEVVDT